MLNDKKLKQFSCHRRSKNAIKKLFPQARPRLVKCFLHANRATSESRLRIFRAKSIFWVEKSL